MAKDGELVGAADMTKRGKGTRKSANITATPMRAEVTPNGKQGREPSRKHPSNHGGLLRRGLRITLVKARESPCCQQKGTRLPR